MIRIDRQNVAVPERLRTDIDSPGKAETEAATKFFQAKAAARARAKSLPPPALPTDGGDKGRKKDTFKFTAYSNGDVKSKLRALFNNKCGYCEIDYGGAVSDIEHFRPKGEIDYEHADGIGTYPEGYYWLGADWENLIYSCQHCNRPETHSHLEQAGAAPVRRVSGKHNFFPLSDETKRLKPCEPVAAEEPYRNLLDPCRDDPREHLVFREDGLVSAKLIGGRPSKRGSESIKLYGLRRLPLVERRRRRASDLLYSIARLDESLAALRANPLDGQLKSTVAERLAQVRQTYLAPDCPFLAMCRTLFLQRVDVKRIATELRVVHAQLETA